MKFAILALLVFSASGMGVAFGANKIQSRSSNAQVSTATTVEVHFIPVDGRLTDVVVDTDRGLAYAANADRNRVEVVSLATNSLLDPIQVGSLPTGLDMTVDGRFLYVANSGGTNVSKVDLSQRLEIKKIDVGQRAFSVAAANNGKVLFSTTFSGSGFGGTVGQIDIATDAVSGTYGPVTEETYLRRSGDGSKTIMTIGDDSGGPVVAYDAATQTFSSHSVDVFVGRGAANENGTRYGVSTYGGALILNAGLGVDGTVFGQTLGIAFNNDGSVGYRTNGGTNQVDAFNSSTFQVTNSIPAGDTVSSAGISLSSDGQILAVPTQHGISIVRPFSFVTPTPTPTPAPTPTAAPTASPTPSHSPTPGPTRGPRSNRDSYKQIVVVVNYPNSDQDIGTADSQINDLAAAGWELLGPPVVIQQSLQSTVLLYTLRQTQACGQGGCPH